MTDLPRKPVPVRVQLDILLEQNGRCQICKKKLMAGEPRVVEHTPARALLERNGVENPDGRQYLSIVHAEPCARLKTVGRHGESKKSSCADGDISKVAKAERIHDGGKVSRNPMRKHATLKRTFDGRTVER